MKKILLFLITVIVAVSCVGGRLDKDLDELLNNPGRLPELEAGIVKHGFTQDKNPIEDKKWDFVKYYKGEFFGVKDCSLTIYYYPQEDGEEEGLEIWKITVGHITESTDDVNRVLSYYRKKYKDFLELQNGDYMDDGSYVGVDKFVISDKHDIGVSYVLSDDIPFFNVIYLW